MRDWKKRKREQERRPTRVSLSEPPMYQVIGSVLVAVLMILGLLAIPAIAIFGGLDSQYGFAGNSTVVYKGDNYTCKDRLIGGAWCESKMLERNKVCVIFVSSDGSVLGELVRCTDKVYVR